MTPLPRSTRPLALAIGLLLPAAALAAENTCPTAPEPVISLDYGSRYTEDSTSRSEIDPKGDAEADEALKPIDDFLRDLTESANGIFEKDADQKAIANCIMAEMAKWAQAGALTDQQSDTSKLTIGARISGFSLVLLQALPHATDKKDITAVKDWLAGLVQAQMAFWEEDAPKGARQGNLRAWSAMGASAMSGILDDPIMRGWAAWSVNYVLCKANPDGSLPQEMSREKFALKYQLHAIAPLVISTLLLQRQGYDLQQVCDNALSRVVGFAVADLKSGAATQKITGATQSFFDGTDELKAFHLAWIEPYLILDTGTDRAAIEALAEEYRPLNYSKIGGKQGVIWQDAD